jgi:hypothetical protein
MTTIPNRPQPALAAGVRPPAAPSTNPTTTHPGTSGATRRTTSWTTIYVDPPVDDQPAAETVVDQLEHLAHELSPGWWRIRRAAL